MSSPDVLIVKYSEGSYVLCTPESFTKFHRYMAATSLETWSQVMTALGASDFLSLWEQYNGDYRLTDGTEILFEPSDDEPETEIQDLSAASNWDADDSSPLVNAAFFELVESPPISAEIVKELGGQMEMMISGIYFNRDPEEIQTILKSHNISSEVVSEIPYLKY